MREVELHNGEKVSSTSEDWRQECEARYVLGKSHGQRAVYIGQVKHRRGEPAADRLTKSCNDVEPSYLLGLATKPLRLQYLAEVRRTRGRLAEGRIRDRVLALHERRKLASAQS